MEKEKATIYDFTRMCQNTKSCNICLLDAFRNSSHNCFEAMIDNTEKVNEIILKWCEEHTTKTRQDKFLEMFPNVIKDNGIIDICPLVVESGYECLCKTEPITDCNICRSKYWLEEV